MSTKFVAEYVWLGGHSELRSKARVLDWEKNVVKFDVNNYPVWNYDGSSTCQAEGRDSEVLIRPCAVFPDPFRKGGVLVLCSTYKPDNTPLPNNHREWADEIFKKKLDSEPWFGIEQEYFLVNKETGRPLGFPKDGYPNPQGQYYCSVGTNNAFGREVVDEHLEMCLQTGLNICGINAEVAPGQWEYQIGPCTGIESGDHLWMSRYLLERVAEKHGVVVDIRAKPVLGDWNGSGCHTNFSTWQMRDGTEDKTGLEHIEEAMEKLETTHREHMEVYGEGNELRMTGKHETASFDTFTYGRADRGASVRIGNETIDNGKGYFEDRRPSSSMDPYLVTGKLFETTVL